MSLRIHFLRIFSFFFNFDFFDVDNYDIYVYDASRGTLRLPVTIRFRQRRKQNRIR